MKQTAVEWLVEKLDQNFDYVADTLIEQAKEMEKQQIIDAHLDGQCFSTTIEEIDYAKDYYNETFKE
jgi:hypothetical protein